MAQINTVKGTMDTSHLGVTLMHEHIFVFSGDRNRNSRQNWGDEEARVRQAIDRLRSLKSGGVDSFVDLTVMGGGRCIPRIHRIAAAVNLNIIVATGLYTFDDLPEFLQSQQPGSASGSFGMLVEMFLKDIREGIDGTGVKAAILKCATDRRGVTPGVELVLRAVARVHQITGVPVSTHTHAKSRSGLEQQRIFAEEGVDLSRVVIGHCGDTTDLDYLERLIEKGSYLGMDRFGIDPVLPFKKRVDTVAELCLRGYSEKIVLSQDAACYNDQIREEKLETTAPNWNFLHIMNDVVPALKERGVTQDQIHTMLVKNPRTIFEGRS